MEKKLEAAVTDPNCWVSDSEGHQVGPLPTFARVIWITGQDCGGCATTILNYLANPGDPDPVLNAIANNALGLPIPDIEALYPLGGDGKIGIDEVVLEIVTIDWAYIVMQSAGDVANQHLAALRGAGGYVLMIDGSIPTAAYGKYCRVFDMPGDYSEAGKPWNDYIEVYSDPYQGITRTSFTMAGATLWLAENAVAVLCLGTCSSWGGIPAAKGAVTQAKSGWEWINKMNGMNKTVANIPGCPPNPDWFIQTVGAFLLGLLELDMTLDHKNRVRLTSTAIYHEQDYVFCEDCPRNDKGTGANIEACRRKAGQADGKCLEDVGCNGRLAGGAHVRPDCPTRMWNKFEDYSNNN
jgi:hydrogenase small subunit